MARNPTLGAGVAAGTVMREFLGWRAERREPPVSCGPRASAGYGYVFVASPRVLDLRTEPATRGKNQVAGNRQPPTNRRPPSDSPQFACPGCEPVGFASNPY